MKQNILITGATGQLGTIVLEHLIKNTDPNQISVLIRDESKSEVFTSRGISVKIGDYFNPDSLINAFQGVDKLLFISSSDFNNRFGQHKNVVDAAKSANVKHILYTSITMNNIEKSPLKPLLQEHFQTEEYIIESGIDYTFLKNGLYADVIPMFLGEDVIKNGVYFAAGEGKVAFAARKDLGEAIAKIAANENSLNKSYNLTSANAYSFSQIANYLSELSGQSVQYNSPESEEFENSLKQFGLPDEIVNMSVLFAAGIKNNDFNTTNDTLKNVLGRETINLKDFLKETYNL